MKHRLIITAFLFTLGIFHHQGVAQDYSNWKYTHPHPQANSLRKIQMLDQNNWVATGANGTFMRTANAGVDWYFHQTAGKYADNAQTIGQNYDLLFTDPSNGFVVGMRGYIGRTTDGGVTFDSLANGLVPVAQRCQSIWFANPDTGYIIAGSSSGFAGTILKTTDAGLNWTSIHSSSAYAFTSVAGVSSEIVCVATMEGSVGRTTDGGATWNFIDGVFPSPNQTMYGVSFVDSTIGFVCGSAGQVSKTTDAGASWTALTPPQEDWTFFQIKVVNPNEMYLIGSPTTLYKSTNLGTSWIALPITPISGPASTYIWYSLDVVGSTLVLSGDFGVVAQSTNAGSSWFANHFQLTTQLMFDIQFVPGTDNVVAVGRQNLPGMGSVLFSSDRGDTWGAINVGVSTDLQAVSMVNSDVGYACGTNSRVLKTTNGGMTWDTTGTRPHVNNYTLQDLEFVTEDTGWVFVNFLAVAGGNIFKTTNGGASWIQQTIGTTDGIAAADMVDANTGYLCLNSSNRPIYLTIDGGATWTPKTTPFTGQIRDISAPDANTVYIGTTTGANRIGKTTDAGGSWTTLSLPGTVDVRNVDFSDVNTGFVCGNLTTAICGTTDGGATWSLQNVHLPTLVGVYAGDGVDAFALGTYSSILKLGNASANLVATSSLTFDTTQISSSTSDSVLIANASGATLMIGSVSSTNTTDFTTVATSFVVPSGDSAWLQVTFHPGSIGLRTGSIVLTHNGSTSPDTISVEGTGTQVSVAIISGWNMISNPTSAANDSVRAIFPSSSFDYAFSFNGSAGYVQNYTMSNGNGYWAKFPSATTNSFGGDPRTSDTVDVNAGWNMVGTISASVDTNDVIAIPPGLRASDWFGYNGGYSASAQLVPGKAYWVKANQSGQFILASSSAPDAPHAVSASFNPLAVLNTLTITDAKGNSQVLYFGTGTEDDIHTAWYEMPPLPPAGGFDARFDNTTGGTMVKIHTDLEQFPVSIQSSEYPVTVEWNIQQQGARYELVEGVDASRLMTGEGRVSIGGRTSSINIKSVGGESLPTEYSLQQNYPNPFNPDTKIAYQLPAESKVSIEIYNLLGQKVRTLVNETQTTGHKTVQWNGKSDLGVPVASGVWLCRMEAKATSGSGSFISMRKMILLK